MRPGRVVYIRVNPKDCIACVDLMDKLRVDTTHMSFDTVVRTALSSLIATVQDAGLLSASEGFDFNEKVGQRFPNSRQQQVQRLNRTTAIDKEMQLREAKDMPQPIKGIPLPQPETYDQQRARRLHQELAFRMSQDIDNFSKEDVKRMTWLEEVIIGDSTWDEYEVLAGIKQ